MPQLPNISLKALVLCAGFGKRLLPLTSNVPKPLVPFFGLTPLELCLLQLKNLGIKDIAANTHYLFKTLQDFFEQKNTSSEKKIFISHEPELLGTGGVYKPLLNWIGDSHLLVLNADVVGTFNLKRLVEVHQEKFARHAAVATMSLLSSSKKNTNPVLTQSDKIIGFGKTKEKDVKEHTFACAQILSTDFFRQLPEEKVFDLKDIYNRIFHSANASIYFDVHEGYWQDIGTISSYAQTHWDLIKNKDAFEKLGIANLLEEKGLSYELNSDRELFFIGKPKELDKLRALAKENSWRRVVVMNNVNITMPIHFDQVIIHEGCVFKNRESLSQMVITPSVRIPIID